MEKTTGVLVALTCIVVICGVLFYIGTHVDCARIPLIGSGCIVTK